MLSRNLCDRSWSGHESFKLDKKTINEAFESRAIIRTMQKSDIIMLATDLYKKDLLTEDNFVTVLRDPTLLNLSRFDRVAKNQLLLSSLENIIANDALAQELYESDRIQALLETNPQKAILILNEYIESQKLLD